MSRRSAGSNPFWLVALGAIHLACATAEDAGDTVASAGSKSAGAGFTSAGAGFTSAGAPGFGGSPSGSAGSAGKAGGNAAGAPSSSGGARSVLGTYDFETGANGWIADKDDPADDDHVGNWAVVADGGGHVYQEQTEYSDVSWTVGGSGAWTDQRVEAKVKFVSFTDDGCQVFLAARYQSPDAYYFMYLKADGSLRLRKRLNGATVELIATTYKTNMPAVPGTWYTLALEIKGSAISASVNGTPIGSAMDSDIQAGGIALGVVDAVAAFDDITVTTP